MRRFLLSLLALAALVGVAYPQDLRYPPKPADRQKILTDGFSASRDRLGPMLMAAYLPGGPSRPGSTGVTAYRGWLQLWKWAELLSRPNKVTGLKMTDLFTGLASSTPSEVGRDIKPELLAEWVADDNLSALLFGNITPQDDGANVLRILQEIRLAQPAKFREYTALAVAFALVYDQPFPSDWPHHQVLQSLVPRRDLPVADRFAQWVQSNEAHELLLDLRKLRPDQLKFIIDAPLDPAEFAWARRYVKYPRADFAKAFSSISYDENRYRQQKYDWTDGDYTLANIMQHGGICVDQAYYAMVAGKARGLPTLFFTGQGLDGGHAWFGYMRQDDRWVLDCGRYENQNFSVGEALDPQTWQPITDHELAMLAKSYRGTLQYTASSDDLLLANLFAQNGQTDKALRAADSAVQVCPLNPEGWRAEGELLKKTGASSSVRRAFHENALQQFAAERDIRVEQQIALAGIAREEGDEQKAQSLERDVVAQNKGRRADLSVNMAASRLAELVSQKKFDDAMKEYRSQINGLGKTGGGNFFNEVVDPFVTALAGTGNAAKAKESLSLARKALKPEAGGILEVEMNELEKAISDQGAPH